MAGAGLVIIKRRIKSISSTRKITKAMGLVAATKLQKMRKSLLLNQAYYNECMNITKEVFENYNGTNIYRDGNDSKNTLVIIFTSERGLCGGFNANVVASATKVITDLNSSVKVMFVGKRGKSYLKKLGLDSFIDLPEMPESMLQNNSEEVAQRILELFSEGEVGQVKVVYTKFISGMKQSVEVEQLLPVPFQYNDNPSDIVSFEPSIGLLAEEETKAYVKENILYYMLNSSASEHSARMNSMNNATRNADELLEKLKLNYNRARQGIITQEISEIVGGAAALR